MKRMERVQATRAADGSYAFVYLSTGNPVTIRMEKLSGQSVKANWYDPRTGASQLLGEFPNKGNRRFDPPSSGTDNDWVLTLDGMDGVDARQRGK